MALGRVAVIAMMVLANTSCLVTEDLEPREPDAGQANVWPRIIDESVSPKNWTPVVPVGDVECLPVDLAIKVVADDNVHDVLWARVFVDYDPNGGPNKVYRTEALINPSNPPQPERSGYTFTFVPRDYCRGYHVVKVLITDGDFERTGEFDQIKQGDRGVVSYSWVVDSTHCPNAAGQCQ